MVNIIQPILLFILVLDATIKPRHPRANNIVSVLKLIRIMGNAPKPNKAKYFIFLVLKKEPKDV